MPIKVVEITDAVSREEWSGHTTAETVLNQNEFDYDKKSLKTDWNLSMSSTTCSQSLF